MTERFDVAIYGDGTAALACALRLAQLRLRVALVRDSAAAHAPTHISGNADVRAWALNGASRALLQSLRCWPEADATPVQRMQVWGDQGGELRFDAHEQGQDALAWIVNVPPLDALLRQALAFQPLIEPRTVTDEVNATLTVVAEGRLSSWRDRLGITWQRQPYGQQALAARLTTEWPHAGAARQWFGPRGSVLALLPLGASEAERRVALVWSLPDEEAAQWLAAEPAALQSEITRRSSEALGALQLDSAVQAWPLAHASAQRWTGLMPQSPDHGANARRWVLLGDAAHTVHPLAGQGLNLGLGDVAALATHLQGRDYWRSLADARVLATWERERRAAWATVGGGGDALQRLFARDDEPSSRLRNLGLGLFSASGPFKRWVAAQAFGGAGGAASKP